MSFQGSPAIAGAQRVLGSLRTANLNVTTDQAITLAAGVAKYAVTAIWVTNVSTNIGAGLAVGGFYTAGSKGGTALVANTQIYTTLTGSTVILPATLVAGIVTTTFTASTLYLSLTTANGSAATADVYVIGVDLT